jgi:hypothetical protein
MKALVKSRDERGLWLQDVPEPKMGINDVKIRVLYSPYFYEKSMTQETMLPLSYS